MTGNDPNRRHNYVTTSHQQLDERLLVLRGGRLDGQRLARVAAVGQRVFCGEGAWAVEDIYLVTQETSSTDGQERFVAVPAFAESS